MPTSLIIMSIMGYLKGISKVLPLIIYHTKVDSMNEVQKILHDNWLFLKGSGFDGKLP